MLLAQQVLKVDAGSGSNLELFLHLGTLFTILIFFRRKILALGLGLLSGCKDSWHYAFTLLLGCLPAGMLYLACRRRLEALSDSALLAAAMLIFTGLILLYSRVPPRRAAITRLSWLQALLVGLAQCLALIPGISRSGSTIIAAYALGYPLPLAVEFSFLMNVPLLLGALFFKHKELWCLINEPQEAIVMLLACIIAATIGFLSLKILYKILEKNSFWKFGIYCMVIGVLASAAIMLKLL